MTTGSACLLRASGFLARLHCTLVVFNSDAASSDVGRLLPHQAGGFELKRECRNPGWFFLSHFATLVSHFMTG
jgi:hypothetical protein